MTFGLTPNGFNKKTLSDEKQDEENALIAEFGEINTQPQSVIGQFIGVFSKGMADLWEELEDVYFSQYPNTAEGISLDYVVALNGITRLDQQRTRVIGVATGVLGTLINQGSLARQSQTQEIFFAETDTVISSNSLVLSTVSIDILDSVIYNVLINGSSYFYSLPKIEFDGIFGIGDSIVASINGTPLTAVPFNTDSQTTIEDLATALQALTEVETATTRLGLVITFDSDFVNLNEIVATINGTPLATVTFNTDQATTIGLLATEISNSPLVTSCTVTDTREITIVPIDEGTFLVDSIVTTLGASQPVPIDQRIDLVPASGFSITVNYVNTSGGFSPIATTSFLEPSDDLEISDALVDIINASSEPITALDNLDGTFDLIADSSDQSFSLSVSSEMSLESVSSPVIFLAQNFGAIPAPIDSLDEILTPISGWETITNFQEGLLGREIETDAELRLRRQNSIKILGAGTLESIRSRILQGVTGVTQALIYENRTMQEEDINVVFSIDFVASNEITFTVNNTILNTITFSVDHVTTMQLIAIELAKFSGIASVTVGGTGDRTLTIVMEQGYDITINNILIENGVTIPNYNIQGGRFAKSFETVVQGGLDEDIANMIWLTKPAGIQTFGNTSYIVTDSQGDPQEIRFSRPTPIYIWINIDLTLYDEETFPNNGVQLVQQAISDYGNSLTIGQDVLIQRVLCQIFEISGIASGAIEISSTLNQNDNPLPYITTDIPIADNEIALFDLDRITIQVV